jgi:hypothetical protein
MVCVSLSPHPEGNLWPVKDRSHWNDYGPVRKEEEGWDVLNNLQVNRVKGGSVSEY